MIASHFSGGTISNQAIVRRLHSSLIELSRLEQLAKTKRCFCLLY